MGDWDMNGDTTRAGYQAEVAAFRRQLAELEDAREVIAVENNALRARVETLEAPFRPCDEKDWLRLFLMIDHSGHGRFWHEVMRGFRAALAGKE